MELEEKIGKKFQKLLNEGEQLLAQGEWDGKQMKQSPSDMDYLRFRTEASHLIRHLCGDDSVHYNEIKKLLKQEDVNSPFYFVQYYGILQSAYNDFVEGFLFDLRTLVSADLLGDFLEQAETLLREKYHIPAASLTGAVLEESLRKLCVKNDIEIPEITSIGKLNQLLAKAKVYNTLVNKEIAAKAVIRNNADHGKWDEVKKEDVEDMIKWVKRFDSDYLR